MEYFRDVPPSEDCETEATVTLEEGSDEGLRLLEDEPESWTEAMEEDNVAVLPEKEKKRQEAIYELIITEKRHCLLLKVLQNVFANGMKTELQMNDKEVEKIFPALKQLLSVHCAFLWRLRELQRQSLHVSCIGDVLCQQFFGYHRHWLKDAYGLFYSQQQQALRNYSETLRTNKKFEVFVRRNLSNLNIPSLRNMGLPELFLAASHRMTKYPLIIESIRKYTPEHQEVEINDLSHALEQVKEILNSINEEVRECERTDRQMEIYQKLDSRSCTFYKNRRFGRSDIIAHGRKLRFEGTAVSTACSDRDHTQIHVVVMTDLVFIFQEINHKYYFPDKQPSVISLDSLIVGKTASDRSNVLYLIDSSRFSEPLYLDNLQPKDMKVWLQNITEAANKAHEDDDLRCLSLSPAVREKCENEELQQLLESLQKKDEELQIIFEEKKRIRQEIQDVQKSEQSGEMEILRSLLEGSYHRASEDVFRISSILHESLGILREMESQEILDQQSVLYEPEDHLSNTTAAVSVPKRSETFCVTNHIQPKKGSLGIIKEGRNSKHKRSALTAKLTSILENAAILNQKDVTQYELLKSKILTSSLVDDKFHFTEELKELREKQQEVSQSRAEVISLKEEIRKLQEKQKAEMEDMREERESFYRQLDALKKQGIILSPKTLKLQFLSTSDHTPPLQERHLQGQRPGDDASDGDSQTSLSQLGRRNSLGNMPLNAASAEAPTNRNTRTDSANASGSLGLSSSSNHVSQTLKLNSPQRSTLSLTRATSTRSTPSPLPKKSSSNYKEERFSAKLLSLTENKK